VTIVQNRSITGVGKSSLILYAQTLLKNQDVHAEYIYYETNNILTSLRLILQIISLLLLVPWHSFCLFYLLRLD
jgi:hypothetical protein